MISLPAYLCLWGVCLFLFFMMGQWRERALQAEEVIREWLAERARSEP